MANHESTSAVRQVHKYLTRKAQARLDPTAVVFELLTGRWLLERADHPPTDLGENFGRAKAALQLVIAAARGAAGRHTQGEADSGGAPEGQ